MAIFNDYIIGFWNYTKCGELNAEESVKEWQELGLNFAMTSNYETAEDKDYILQVLNECEKRNIKAVVCSSKTLWTALTANGEEAYEKAVCEITEAFGKHPAFYALSVGDEPHYYEWEDMQKAVKIVNKHARAYINFLPIVESDRQHKEGLGVPKKDYYSLLVNTVKLTGLQYLSYDCYTQCNVHNAEKGLNNYFENLNCFKKASDESGVPFITTLLCVGHWNYREPTEDDIRWQISTAAAHGAKGILWFFIYERQVDSSYRNPPVNFMNEKTRTYEYLKRQNTIFAHNTAQKLFNAKLIRTYHYKKAYGGTKKYKNGCIKDFKIKTLYGNPLIISGFEDAHGEFYMIVNNSQRDVEQIDAYIGGERFKEWLAPGQSVILSKKGEKR